MLGAKFSIQSNDFISTATRTFKDLLLDNSFTDVTLACEDEQQINAHKVILSSASNFFERVFLKNPKKDLVVYLKGISFRNLELMMNFIYLGVVELNEEELQTFLDAAKELEVKGLNNDLTQNVSENFDIDELSEVDSAIKDPGHRLVRLSEGSTTASKVKTKTAKTTKTKENDDSRKIENPSNDTITITDEELFTNVAISEDCIKENIDVDVKTEIFPNVTAIMNSPIVQNEWTKISKVDKSLLVSGKIKSQGSDSGNIECKECHTKFSSSAALTNHRRNKHEGISYSCEYCAYKNGQAGNLRRHVIKKHSK